MTPQSFLLHFNVTTFLKNVIVWGIFLLQIDFFPKKMPSWSQSFHEVENDTSDHFYCFFMGQILPKSEILS